MISKEIFVKTLRSLEVQIQKDHRFAEGLNILFPNACTANLLPSNDVIIEATIQLLEESMKDAPVDLWQDPNQSWITYFCWELDFGSKNLRLQVWDADGNLIPMRTAEQLYDFLTTPEPK